MPKICICFPFSHFPPFLFYRCCVQFWFHIIVCIWNATVIVYTPETTWIIECSLLIQWHGKRRPFFNFLFVWIHCLDGLPFLFAKPMIRWVSGLALCFYFLHSFDDGQYFTISTGECMQSNGSFYNWKTYVNGKAIVQKIR